MPLRPYALPLHCINIRRHRPRPLKPGLVACHDFLAPLNDLITSMQMKRGAGFLRNRRFIVREDHIRILARCMHEFMVRKYQFVNIVSSDYSIPEYAAVVAPNSAFASTSNADARHVENIEASPANPLLDMQLRTSDRRSARGCFPSVSMTIGGDESSRRRVLIENANLASPGHGLRSRACAEPPGNVHEMVPNRVDGEKHRIRNVLITSPH
jgi:hypothetical protein